LSLVWRRIRFLRRLWKREIEQRTSDSKRSFAKTKRSGIREMKPE
jgi:hypothetical protein